MLAAERHGWQDPRILFMLLFVFLSGAAVGALTMRGLHDRLPHSQGLAVNRENVNLSYDKLRTELNLTPEQSERLRTILDDFVMYNHDIEAQVASFRATGKNRIRQILTPEQRAKFEKISSEVAAP